MKSKISLFYSNIFWNLNVKQRLLINKNQKVIFWGHLGLGDQISSAVAIEKLSSQCALLIIPSKSRNYDCISKLYGRWKNVDVVEICDDSICESNEIYRLQEEFDAKVLYAGHLMLKLARFIYPNASLNEWLNLCAGIEFGNLISTKLRNTILQMEQFVIPNFPYAFVDHHPGTDRQISQEYLNNLKSRGLRIVMNPREIPLYSLLRLMDNAVELHMVASAPLCLALTTKTHATLKYYYKTPNQGNLNSPAYIDWLEVDSTNFPNNGALKLNFLRRVCFKVVFSNRMLGD